MAHKPYALLDSGDEQRLERFGDVLLIRPCSQAVWKPKHPKLWRDADATFTRDDGNRWIVHKKLPDEWIVYLQDLKFHLSPTDFGHVGLFPEHHHLWSWMEQKLQSRKEPARILNLFAYTGAASVKLAKSGAKVCHLDASKKSVGWAADNAKLNEIEGSIRWIVDDAMKFLEREVRRGSVYDGIILDPPSFGKGTKGEIFKIEKDIVALLELCKKVLSPQSLFVVFTCHTPGFTPSVMKYLMQTVVGDQKGIEVGEMLIDSINSYPLPSGVFARWASHG